MNILLTNQQRHRPLNKKKIIKAARTILSHLEQSRCAGTELSILFVGDRKMLQLNTDYRGVRNSTDVLSFEARIPAKKIDEITVLGDVVINVQRAESQAQSNGTAFYDEIHRLLIHGILHLVGYDHEHSRYRAQKMRKKEQEIFHALKKMDSKY